MPRFLILVIRKMVLYHLFLSLMTYSSLLSAVSDRRFMFQPSECGHRTYPTRRKRLVLEISHHSGYKYMIRLSDVFEYNTHALFLQYLYPNRLTVTSIRSVQIFSVSVQAQYKRYALSKLVINWHVLDAVLRVCLRTVH